MYSKLMCDPAKISVSAPAPLALFGGAQQRLSSFEGTHLSEPLAEMNGQILTFALHADSAQRGRRTEKPTPILLSLPHD